jgi:hypothetical protein
MMCNSAARSGTLRQLHGAPLTGLVAAHFGARTALGMGAVAALLAGVGGGLAPRRIRNEERADRQLAAG